MCPTVFSNHNVEADILMLNTYVQVQYIGLNISHNRRKHETKENKCKIY